MRQETEGTCPRARWLACTFATPFKVPRSRRPRRRDMTRAAAETENGWPTVRCRRRSRQRSRRSSIVSGQTASSRGRRGWCPSTSSRRRRAPRSSRGRCHGGSTNLAKKVGVGGSMHTLRHTAQTSMGPRRGADGGRVPHRRARVHPAVGANGARHPSGIRAPLVGEMVDADRHDDGGDSRLAGSRRELAQLHGRRRGCAPTVLLVYLDRADG